MADIDIETDSWRTHASDATGIGQVVEQGGSAYMAALDGNVFGVFTPMILPAYTAVSEIFAQRNTEFGQRVQKGAELLKNAANDFDQNEQTLQERFNSIGQQIGEH